MEVQVLDWRKRGLVQEVQVEAVEVQVVHVKEQLEQAVEEL